MNAGKVNPTPFWLYNRRSSGLIGLIVYLGEAHAVGRPTRMSTDDVLVTEGLSKSFGDFRAVSDVSLRIKRGTITL